MAWEVLFYQTTGGDSPVEEFLDTLSVKARAKCLAYLRQLEEHGFDLPHSVIAKVRGKIWELRPERGGTSIGFSMWRLSADGSSCSTPSGSNRKS